VNGGVLVLAAGVLLAASVAASLVAARLRLPALMLFLAVGMAGGSSGAGWISFRDYGLARDLGIAALAVILFDGALHTGFAKARHVLGAAVRLAVGATAIVAVLVGSAASLLLGRPLLQGMLIGSILASTDSAAVFGLLHGSTLRGRLVRTIEAESGFNDAVALVLVVGFAGWISHPGRGGADLITGAASELAFGAVSGVVVGLAAAWSLVRIRLPATGLYAVASFAAAALAFGAATSLHGSGLLAVYLAGLLIADAQIPSRRTIAAFHDGLAWVAQVGLFLMLGLLVTPGRLGDMLPVGLTLAILVVLVARPLATFAMTDSREFTRPERVLLSWAEFVGATPILFAAFAVVSGVPDSAGIFDLVVVVVIFATMAQGLTFEPLARALGLTTVQPLLPAPLVEFGGARSLGAELLEYPVTMSDDVVGRRVRDLRLPLGITPVLIVRGDEAVPPSGVTLLKAGDVLHLLVRTEVAGRIPELIARLSTPGADAPIARRRQSAA
jgi:cell volume regulation protein A